MEQIVVKSEMESNSEILLFYMDENGGNEEGVMTTIENIEQGQIRQLHQDYVIQEVEEPANEIQFTQQDQALSKERWLDEETRRLLIFYIDNKETFINGTTRKKHLWTVACKTMLPGKNPTSCEMKVRNLKRKYALARVDEINGKNRVSWSYYDLCHQAFHDDAFVNILLSENTTKQDKPTINVPVAEPEDNNVFFVKKTNPRSSPDEKVELMLNLYLQHKKKSPKDYWQKNLWEKIAMELGEDGEYWHKRFLNFKQHYIRMLDKRTHSGSQSIQWPYMKIFDTIYADDEEFKKKYSVNVAPQEVIVPTTDNKLLIEINSMEWDDTERTVLVKYFFDSFDEFQDTTIPNSFLWNEVGRLLDKPSEICKQKYEEMKTDHLTLYINGGYDLRSRKPIAILFDNIISKETEIELAAALKKPKTLESWETETLDELVQYILDNIELFKDTICHFVCWVVVSMKINKSTVQSRLHWQDLTTLYKSILDDKKENSDMQIDWRYIELFDRIFDYGMDTKLLEGYEVLTEKKLKKKLSDTGKIGVKKLKINLEDDLSDNGTEDEDYDERGSAKRSRGSGDSKQFKILEFYQRNKDKFATTARKKQALWEILAKEIRISAEQCAHRFRNLKQVYTAYVQREINKPEMPILWPYYALCKKVFGYRAIKNKLKNGHLDSDDSEDWTAKEIKQLINYFSNNFDKISNTTDDKTAWSALAHEIGKSESSCRDKFLELRKSYRKIKTMMSKNSDCKVNWKYFKLFDEIFSKSGEQNAEAMELESIDEKAPLQIPLNMIKNEVDDEDFQCIIVIPEGEELADLSKAQIIMKGPETIEPPKKFTPRILWSIKSKKQLLNYYLDYITIRKGKIINTREMWADISSRFKNRTVLSCKKMYIKIKKHYKQNLGQSDDGDKKYSGLNELMEKILAAKPKLYRPECTIKHLILSGKKMYTDVDLPLWKVELALKYYLEHIEEFVSPKYEKKLAWTACANAVSLPVYKVFRKINFLKQCFNIQSKEVKGEQFEYADLLKEIIEKEFMLKIALENEPTPMTLEDNSETTHTWLDEETERLLVWYLENLEKFKNPKYVTSYLWMEASKVLQKSALECSKKMSEIRTQYSTMVKETPEALNTWQFHELCQKIYGTGKKSTPVNSD